MTRHLIKVLIADNNIELCRTIQEFLDSQGDMEVVGIAHDGVDALSELVATCPDVLILDITMPNLDGMAVLERMSGLNLTPRPKVIVLTALGREDVIQRFTDLGAHYFIVKPFDLELLAERIRQFAGSKPTVSSNESKDVATSSISTGQGFVETSQWVTQLLHEMGVPPNFKGYNYLRDAVLLTLRDPQLLGGALTKRLYPQLAEKYGSTPGGVEAAIRNAVLASCERGNREFIEKLCGPFRGSRKTWPTNSIVIAKLADTIRMQRKVG